MLKIAVLWSAGAAMRALRSTFDDRVPMSIRAALVRLQAEVKRRCD
jgi:hypothetical protein